MEGREVEVPVEVVGFIFIVLLGMLPKGWAKMWQNSLWEDSQGVRLQDDCEEL